VLDSPIDMSGKPTKKNQDSDMRDEYDFSAGLRGKYAKRYAEGTNVMVLDPDVAAKMSVRGASAARGERNDTSVTS
jgi:hypothetical protein